LKNYAYFYRKDIFWCYFNDIDDTILKLNFEQNGTRMVGKVILKILKIIGKTIGYIILMLLIIITAAGVSGLLFAYNQYLEIKPEMDAAVAEIETSAFDTSGPTTLYYWDKNSDSWAVLDTLYTEEERNWLTFDQIPENVINAAVAIEDKTFWEHHGVNWLRTIESTFNYVVRHRKETAGGSTITQQVIKNLTGNWTVNATRKITEILEALSFEQMYSKEQILELYLNNIYLGSNCYGIYAASHKYFDKNVADLSLVEAACLVSITNNPSYYDPYRFPEHVKFRAAVVIHEMCDQGYISETDELRALAEIGFSVVLDENNEATFIYEEERDSFVFKDGSPSYSIVTEGSDHIYSWYEDVVIDKAIQDLMDYYDCDSDTAFSKLYNGSLSIYTAFDPDVQKELDKIYLDPDFNEDHINIVDADKDEAPQSACVVIDNDNCAVIALEGGAWGKTESRSFNRATDALRQPGSSIKPLCAYAPALEEGLITEYSSMVDSPFEYDEDGNPWPVNAYGGYNGTMSMKYAVTYSCNTIAVKVVELLGLEESYYWVSQKFRISTLVEEDKKYSAIALGGLTDGLSVFEITNAFTAFARDGIYTEAYLFYSIVDTHGNTIVSHGSDADKILSDDTVEQMDDMLYANTLYGTAENADVDGIRCAGKTGTSTGDQDVWFIGYTSRYTVGVWTGYDDNTRIENYYPNPSCDTWHDIISAIQADD